MFERFTERARKVMTLARQEAQRLNSEFIGTEHILLGIIQEGGGVAAKVLKKLNVDVKKTIQEVEKLITPQTSPPTVTLGQLPFSPRAKRVFELSSEAMSQLGNDVIGTEHLLLGLLKENEGIAAQVLLNMGLKLDEVRDATLEILGADIGPEDLSGDYTLVLTSGLTNKQISDVLLAVRMIKGVLAVEKVSRLQRSVDTVLDLTRKTLNEVEKLKNEFTKSDEARKDDDPPLMSPS
jgi:ATP-dependent Clp protease ATP-binding subunit ClpA